MAFRGGPKKAQKVMVQPINHIFRYLQSVSVRNRAWDCNSSQLLAATHAVTSRCLRTRRFHLPHPQCACVCLFSVCLSSCLAARLPVYLLAARLPVYLPVYLSTYLLCLSVRMLLCISVCAAARLPVYLPTGYLYVTCQSISQSVMLPISLSVVHQHNFSTVPCSKTCCVSSRVSLRVTHPPCPRP